MVQKIKIRRKPLDVEAIQWNNNEAEIRDFIKDDSLLRLKEDNRLEVWNLDNQSWCNVPMFHFIVRGIKGELYPISPEILERTFDRTD